MRAITLFLILLLFHTLAAIAGGSKPPPDGPGKGKKAADKADPPSTPSRSQARITRRTGTNASNSVNSNTTAQAIRRDWTVRPDGLVEIHDSDSSQSSSSSEDDDDREPAPSTNTRRRKRIIESDEETHVSSSTTGHQSTSRVPDDRGEPPSAQIDTQPPIDSTFDLMGWQYYLQGVAAPLDHPVFGPIPRLEKPQPYESAMATERRDLANSDRPFHRWFEFGTATRDSVFERLLTDIMSSLTELSLRTGAHFALNLGRPDSPESASTSDAPDTWNFVSGSISRDPELRRLAEQLGEYFGHKLHVPLRRDFLERRAAAVIPEKAATDKSSRGRSVKPPRKRAAQPMTPGKVPPAKRQQKQPSSRSKSQSSCAGASEPETDKTPVPAKNKGKSKAMSESAEPEQIADDGDGGEEAEEDPDIEKKRMWEEHEARRLWTEAQMRGGGTIEPGPSSSRNNMQNPSFRSSASSRTSSLSRPDSPTPQGVARPIAAPSRDPQLSDEECASRNGISGQQLHRLKRARLKWLPGAERTKADLNPLFVRHQILAESRQQQVNQPPPSTAPERPPTPPTSPPPDTDTTTRIPSMDPSAARHFERGPSAAGSNSGIDAFEPNLPASIIQYLEQEGFTADVFMDVEIALGGAGGYEDWQERLLRLAALAPLTAKYIALLKWRDRKGDEAEGK